MNRLALAASALVLAAVAALAQAPRPAAPKLPDGAKLVADVKYGPHERNSYDLYLPKPAESGKPAPLLVWVHGGAWLGGDKAGGGPGIGQLHRGYAVASVNYRLSPHAPFPAQIADVRAALRHLRRTATERAIDPDRVAAWGSSAGGHLVALLATGATVKELDGDLQPGAESAAVKAVINWFGPADLRTMPKTDDPKSPESRLLGGLSRDKPDLAKLASPLAHVTRASAPLLIVHGDADRLVPLTQSEKLRDAYAKAGAECELIAVAGAGHGGPQFLAPERRKATEAFLDKHLGKP